MPPKPTPKRCAVYTRKSSEEGLEQDFNSLQAQRESCEAFVKSQKAEGWRLIETAYDDGGFSGGSMERPGLRRLLDDIRARRIDIVVVYKIDRLTRALADFAKMVEVFDGHGVSFVAVTQQFNTTTSMGRLTLNILLSFAQFEREVTAERIRDKIAASKKKGMWMGGNVPLGYDVQDKKLVVNELEAETVRVLFRHYLDLGCVRRLKQALDADGIVSKRRVLPDGRILGGKPFLRGALYTLLSNPLYIGEIRHGSLRHPGLHQAIVERDLWDRVQARLSEQSVDWSARATEPSPLAGLICDASGERLTPSHANKKGRRYRYYVSRSLVTGDAAEHQPGWRLPAPDLERAVSHAAAGILFDHQAVAALLQEVGLGIAAMPVCLAKAATLVQRLEEVTDPTLLTRLIRRVEIAEEAVSLTMDLTEILPNPGMLAEPEALILTRTIPWRMRRRGVEMRLIIGDRLPAGKADPALIKAIARGRRWWSELETGAMPSIAAIARRDNVSPGHVGHLLPLAFLAPSIIEAIVAGKYPVELTADALIKRIDPPLDWQQQRRLLGCG